ncbi:MAG: Gfo/Idh/MocA family oxidoreductase [Micromonosporaceae bacterium]|nr:Gfo/Idh/MocA family oxidoreductase [Micromonosporaceae bacterium]
MRSRRRYAVVGAGARAETFVRSLVTAHKEQAELVAFVDVNLKRIAAHNRWLGELGHPAVPAYHADDFARMLDEQRVDTVIVTSMDVTHERYIVGALDADRSVITEKPMTTTAESCTRILQAARRARERAAAAGIPAPTCAVAFNYRYNPTHVKVRELLASGAIGTIGSVHFEWLLDVRHGADYFRRWHRDAANSGGLLVHKSSHHFDLVNWWLSARPARVFAANRLFFYGAGRPHGYDRGYERAYGSPAAKGDPFALDLDRQPRMRELYLETEAEDGYIRDRNVFAPGATIDDDMAVLVQYDSGATMTYHLHAYAPWEGYRLMVNGSRGRLELEVVETAYVAPDAGAASADAGTIASLYPGHSGVENGWTKLTLHPFWQPPSTVEIPEATQEAHGGGDARLTADLFTGSALTVDPLGRRATEVDGALALLTGLAANASSAAGRPYDVAELVDPDLLKES